MVLRIKCLKTTHYNAQYNPSPMHTKCICICIYYMTIIFDSVFYIIYNSILIGIPVTAWFHWSFLILMIWIMNRREGQMNDMLQTLSSVTGFNFTPTEGAVVLNWENIWQVLVLPHLLSFVCLYLYYADESFVFFDVNLQKKILPRWIHV